MQGSPKKLVSEGTEPPVRTCSHVRAEPAPSQWPGPKSPREAWLRRCPAAVVGFAPRSQQHIAGGGSHTSISWLCPTAPCHTPRLCGGQACLRRSAEISFSDYPLVPIDKPLDEVFLRSWVNSPFPSLARTTHSNLFSTSHRRVTFFFLTSYLFFPPQEGTNTASSETFYFTTKLVPRRKLGAEKPEGPKQHVSDLEQLPSPPGPHGFNSKVLIQTHLWWQLCEPLIGDSCVKPLIGVGSSQAHTWFYFCILSRGPRFKQWDYKKRASLELETFMDRKRNQSESWEIPDTKCLLK